MKVSIPFLLVAFCLYLNVGYSQSDEEKLEKLKEHISQTNEQQLKREIANVEKKIQDPQKKARILFNVGNSLYLLDRFEEALDYSTKSLRIQNSIYKGKDHPELATCYITVGSILFKLYRLEEALKYSQKALTMFESLYKDKAHLDPVESYNLAISYNIIGETLSQLNRLKEALEYSQKTVKMFESLYKDKAHSDLARSYNNLGNILLKLEHPEEALQYSQKAVTMFESLYKDKAQPDPIVSYNLATFYNNLGGILFKLERLEEALKYSQKAVTMFESLPKDNLELGLSKYNLELAIAYNTVGAILSRLNRLEEGLKYSQKALTMFKNLYKDKDHPNVANLYNNIGNILAKLNRLEEALEYFQKALTMFKNLYKDKPHPDLAIGYDDLSIILAKLNRSEEALEYSQKALTIFKNLYKDKDHPDLATAYDHLGIILTKLNRLEEAKEYCQKALQIFESIYKDKKRLDLVNCYVNISFLFLTKQSQESFLYLEKAFAMQQSLYQDNLAVWSTQDKITNAFVYFNTILHLYFNFCQLNYPDFHQLVYKHWVWRKGIVDRILINEKKIFTEIAKDTKLKEMWQEYQTLARNLSKEINQKYERFSLDRLQSLTDQRKQKEMELSKASKAFQEFLNMPEIQIEQIQRELPPKSLLLDFAVYVNILEQKLWLGVFIVSQNTVKFYPIGNLEEIESQIKSVRDYITTQNLQRLQKVSTSSEKEFMPSINMSQEEKLLQEKLLILTNQLFPGSINKELDGKETLIIFPDEVLHYFPFEVLVTTDDEQNKTKQQEKSLRYWVEKYNIVYILSAQDMLPKERKYGNGFLGFGNPQFKDSNLRLQSQELKPNDCKLVGLNPNMPISLFLEAEATEKTFKEQLQKNKWFWLHVSTHGLFWQDKRLFFLPLNYKNDLNQKILSEDLKRDFQKYGYALDGKDKIEVEKENQSWMIHHTDNIKYLVQTEENLLQVYASSTVSSKSSFLPCSVRGNNLSNRNSLLTLDFQPQDKKRYLIQNPLSLSSILFTEVGEINATEDGYCTAEEVALLPMSSIYCSIFSCCETGLGLYRNAEGLSGFKEALNFAGVQYALITLWKIPDKETEPLIEKFYEKAKGYPAWQAMIDAKRDLIKQNRENLKHSHPYFWAGIICNGKPEQDIPSQIIKPTFPQKDTRKDVVPSISVPCKIKVEAISQGIDLLEASITMSNNTSNTAQILYHGLEIPIIPEIKLTCHAKQKGYLYIGYKNKIGQDIVIYESSMQPQELKQISLITSNLDDIQGFSIIFVKEKAMLFNEQKKLDKHKVAILSSANINAINWFLIIIRE